MQNPLIRRCAAPITGAALVTGVMLIGAPANAETSVTNFTSSCQAKSILTVDKSVAASMTVDAPASVEPGETFTYRIQPNASAFPNSDSGATTVNLSRLKYDYAIPDNATFVSAAVVPGTAVNISGVAPNVLRVAESGAVDNAAGPIIRLSGNNEVIGNGANNNLKSEGGIVVPKDKKNLDGSTNSAGDSWYQLPAVDITVTAGASGVIQPKVRTAGSASSYGNDQNFSTSLAKASLFGTQWAPTRCIASDNKSTPNAGAGPLATINIVADTPVDVATTTTLSAPASAETGATVTLTATVAPGEATGSVQFQDNGTDIGSPVEVSGGSASLDHTFTSAGSHSVTAVFTATGNFTGSTSSASTVTVSDPAPVDVETTLGLTVPQDAETGTAVDLTANVTPADAQGTVQFKDNGADIGSPVTVAAGAATLSHSFTAAGAHAITAEFVGAPGFTGSTAGAQTVTVADPEVPDTQTTTTVSVPASAETGAEVTLSATVAPVPTGGTVQFQVGGNDIGMPVSIDAAGQASIPYTFNAAGSYAVAAKYSGATGFTASTASASTVAVSDPAPSDVATTTILNVPGNAKTGEAQDLVATVYDNGTEEAIAGAGTVEFFDGGASIGSAQVTDGVATLSHTFTTSGTHTITATFSGATGFTGSNAAAKDIVVTVPTAVDVETTTVVTVPATATAGSQVQLTAEVTGAGDAAVTGTVQFFDGDTPIGDAAQVVNGVATLNHTFTKSGAHNIHAVFSGDQGVADSTSSTQTVQVSGGTSGGSGSLGNLGAILKDLLGGLNFGS